MSNPLPSRKTKQLSIQQVGQENHILSTQMSLARTENLDYANNRIWIPSGKTANARRFVGMSERMRSLLDYLVRRTDGGVGVPIREVKVWTPHNHSQGIPSGMSSPDIDGIVPYSARHTYGTSGMTATKNVFVVAKAMGHADIKSMEPYQAIDRRNRERDFLKRPEHSGHTSGHTASVSSL